MMECFRCNVVSKVTYRADVFISLSVLIKKNCQMSYHYKKK